MTLAWWFCRESMTLGYGDKRKVVVGETLTVDPPIEMCKRGLHASERLIDALRYAPGPIVCRVRLGGEILTGDDKLCATERTVLSAFDATRVLHEFACDYAANALSKVRNPDPRLVAAIETKRRWLAGKATDDDVTVARCGAVDAALSPSGCAACWLVAYALRHRPEDAAWCVLCVDDNTKLTHAIERAMEATA